MTGQPRPPIQSQERDTEQRGHCVEPALGVAVAGVADLHVRLIEDQGRAHLFF